MPLNAFISNSINYLKNVCSCDADDILLSWCIHEGSFHYRAQFLVLKGNRYFEIAYQDIGQMFTVSEIEILDKKDISRKDIRNAR